MSGGAYNYFYCQMEEHANDFHDKELNELMHDLADLHHEWEWFMSGDTGEGSWNEERDAFKKKWFTSAGRQKRIEKYLDELRDEVFDMLGMNNNKCQNCNHWMKTAKDDYYGDCDLNKYVLMHRSERCERFEQK